jgi:sulfate permease, SulP family
VKKRIDKKNKKAQDFFFTKQHAIELTFYCKEDLMYRPELLKTVKNYDAKTFFSDLSAGLIVVVVSLPLAIAFAIASGVSPERGIFTAIIGGFCISALGGSRVQIGGPSGTFAVVVYSLVSQYGYEGLVPITIIAGAILLILGVLKLGGLVRFIPYTIVTGFTAGAAVLICTSQLGDFFGLTVRKLPPDFTGKIITYARSLGSVNLAALAVSFASLAILLLWPRINKKIPAALVAIILMTVAVAIFQIPVPTIGSRFGSIPNSFQKPVFPTFDVTQFAELFSPAFSLAMLIAIESLLSAVVADGMTGLKHNSNSELVAHGVANILCPLFGGIPVTAAVARTATNIKNGGKTPVAGVINAVCLLLIMLFLGKLAVYIPMSTLAAILVVVSYNMSGIPSIKSVLSGQKSDSMVMIVTFVVTVFISMTLAIEIGLLLAAFFFIKKMIDLSCFTSIKNELVAADANNDSFDANSFNSRRIPKGVLVYEIEGPLFFGSIQKFEEALSQASYKYKVLILRMRNTIYLDAGGINIIDQLNKDCLKKKVVLLISDIHTQPFMIASKTGLDARIGEANIFGNLDEALERASAIIGAPYARKESETSMTREKDAGSD